MMKEVYTSAIKKSSQLRLSLGYNLFQPLNIYDVCAKLGIEVQLVDINMEGLYISNGELPRILLSNLRPATRRVFTCAHELGHHLFNHGFKIDIITNESLFDTNIEEKQVDTFAAHFLMPVLGINSEFIKRKITLENASELEYYKISSLFSVGYETLIQHCYFNALITESKKNSLLKYTPAKILKQYYIKEYNKYSFKIIDEKGLFMPIDLEVDSLLIIPKSFDVDYNYLELFSENETENIYKTVKAGISNIYFENKGCFIRIQPKNYTGYTEYRHLEN